MMDAWNCAVAWAEQHDKLAGWAQAIAGALAIIASAAIVAWQLRAERNRSNSDRLNQQADFTEAASAMIAGVQSLAERFHDRLARSIDPENEEPPGQPILPINPKKPDVEILCLMKSGEVQDVRMPLQNLSVSALPGPASVQAVQRSLQILHELEAVRAAVGIPTSRSDTLKVARLVEESRRLGSEMAARAKSLRPKT